MSKTNRIEINKEIYMWAIRESQINYDEIKLRFDKIDAWISQESLPTFRQVERLANFLKVPLGYMFLDEPPKKDVIQSEFRTIGNKLPGISKELKDTLYSIGRKKDWLSEYRKEKGWKKLIPDEYNDLASMDVETICFVAKEFISLDEFWYKRIRKIDSAYKHLREKLENGGITVMQNGVVGTNSHRKLDIEEFRGFLLNDEIAPFIFINNNDSAAGKIFTLVHEYIHFLLGEDDILVEEDFEHKVINEQKINKITAEFLMPTSHMADLWDDGDMGMKQIEKLSDLFHVSQFALALKLRDMGKIDQQLLNQIRQQTHIRVKKKIKAGEQRDYYNTSRSRFGDNFISTVIMSAESGDITFTHAFKLLDNAVKLYDHCKQKFMIHEF